MNRPTPTSLWLDTAAAGEDVADVAAEVEAARSVGLPAAFTEETDLPFPVAGAIRLDEQAEFHPRRFLLGLAEHIERRGGRVVEHTRALGVHEGKPCEVRTASATVRAGHVVVATQHVVVATHFQFLDRGLFFARMAPMRSYAIAVRTKGPRPRGMYISTDEPSHSIRAAPARGGELLIVGGESPQDGQADSGECYRRLEGWARERFEVRSVEYRWSSQDNVPADGFPYVGAITAVSRRVLTATGFRKWGFTNGAAAAIMLADAIAGRENPWRATFDANRFTPRQAATTLVKENANVWLRFVGDRLRPADARSVDELAPGEGGIVHDGLQRVAASRDEDGELTVLSPTCTHLGCHVRWNGAERTWDCPCHGSRFDARGGVIEGPAVEDLPRRPAPQRARARAG